MGWIPSGAAGGEIRPESFQDHWTHVSESSAVIYWRLPEIRDEALSYIEYGLSPEYGEQTLLSREPRWAHLHRLTGLKPGRTYHYRMVHVNPETREQVRSGDFSLQPRLRRDAIRIPEEGSSPPYRLDRSHATYLLTRNIRAPGSALEITGDQVTLDLDGHTVVFGDDTDQQVFGIRFRHSGKAVVCNGHLVQGRRSGKYSSALESRYHTEPVEVFGITTDVHLPCAYPVRLFGKAANVAIHHNHLFSRVTELESRHYPGNDLLRMDDIAGNIRVHHNLLTEGCHIALRLGGGKSSTGRGVEVHHNDIRHHQQYVNGYAIAASCPGADIHHNRITSIGRAVHLTGAGIRLHHNWMDTRGHMTLDDIPARSRPFQHQRVELHGVKFEGKGARNCRVHDNYMRIIQPLPGEFEPWRTQGDLMHLDPRAGGKVYVLSEATGLEEGKLEDETRSWEKDRWRGYLVKYHPQLPPVVVEGNGVTSLRGPFQGGTPGSYAIYARWDWVPATPLNVACYDPVAMNEVYGNTFIALTEYRRTRHGGYGNSGQWASALYFVGMTGAPAREGKYSIYIHDNLFISNDLFASGRAGSMTIRVEGNRFTLARTPEPTEGHRPFRGIGEDIQKAIRDGGNIFEGMKPEPHVD